MRMHTCAYIIYTHIQKNKYRARWHPLLASIPLHRPSCRHTGIGAYTKLFREPCCERMRWRSGLSLCLLRHPSHKVGTVSRAGAKLPSWESSWGSCGLRHLQWPLNHLSSREEVGDVPTHPPPLWPARSPHLGHSWLLSCPWRPPLPTGPEERELAASML